MNLNLPMANDMVKNVFRFFIKKHYKHFGILLIDF